MSKLDDYDNKHQCIRFERRDLQSGSSGAVAGYPERSKPPGLDPMLKLAEV